jgi:hypothetical protein
MESRMSFISRAGAALLFIIAVGVGLRLVYLDAPMRYDEAATVQFYVVKPLSESLADYSLPNNHLLHTLLAHLSYRAFGIGEWAVRLPAFVAGVLLIPAVYLAGRALVGRSAALIAAALCAVSAPLILYSVNARGYSLVVLAFVALLIIAARLREAARGGESWRAQLPLWAAFVIVGALGMWAIPVMLYPLAIVGVWLLLGFAVDLRGAERLRAVGALLLAGGLMIGMTLLLYAPVLQTWGIESLIDNDFVRARDWAAFSADLPGFIGGVWASWTEGIPPLVAWSMLALAAVGVSVGGGRGISLLALVIPLGLVLFQRTTGYERVWLFLLPLFYLNVGAGAAWVMALVGRGEGLESERVFEKWSFSRRGEACLAPTDQACQTISERTSPIESGRTRRASSLLAVGVAALLGAEVVASDVVGRSYDTGAFHAGRQVAEHLRAALEPGDRVLTDRIGGRILRYYELALDFTWAAPSADEPAPPRVFIAVNTHYSSLDDRLAALGDRIDLTAYSPPALLFEADDGQVYLMIAR